MKNPKEKISAIREILFNDWDPLNVKGNFIAPDEYDDYLGPVLKLLEQNPSLEKISSFLKDVEIQELGGVNNDENTVNAALKLKALSETFE